MQARVQGFIVLSYIPRSSEALWHLADWMWLCVVRGCEGVMEGLENTSAAFNRMLSSGNIGKQLVKI